MRPLQEILRNVDVREIYGAHEVEVADVTNDSRQVKPGGLFVAVRGVAVDAHRFIPSVIDAGARVVVCETAPEQRVEGVTYVVVEHCDIALAHIASNWYGNPSSRLKLVGVTGTNGKTTIATLLYNLVKRLGHKAGLLSTVCNIVDEQETEAKQTTPDHMTLNALLAAMVDAGCEYAFMEVSSHACAQHRIDGLTFAGGIFTNLTRDHLDFHKTVDEYIKAKKRFFDMLPQGSFALINADDKVGDVMVQNTRAAVRHYSVRSLADYKARVVESRLDGMTLLIDGREVEVLLSGHFNAYNLLAVYGTALLLGFDRDDVAVSLSSLQPVNGRFQTLRSPQTGVLGIVDYAHTPDALENVLTTIRAALPQGSAARVITVCGCGGNRDAGKRPQMAAIAARLSDQLVLTSDNPRDEDPDEILRQMLAGLTDEQQREALVITDRAQAIKTACTIARRGDVILVAGKGHETYQEINGVKHHFDDREQLRQALNIK